MAVGRSPYVSDIHIIPIRPTARNMERIRTFTSRQKKKMMLNSSSYYTSMLIIIIIQAPLCVTAFASLTTKYVSHRNQHEAFKLAPQQLGEFKPINLVGDYSNEGKDIDRSSRRVWFYDFISNQQTTTIPYKEAWDLQKRLMEKQLSRIGKRPKDPPLYDQFIPLEVSDDEGSIDNNSLMGCDSIIMLQHDPVYTLGTASDTSFIHDYDENSSHQSRIPIVRIERGGEVTYHGPGQITCYPILDLRGYNQDIHWYMRALEEAVLLALKKAGVTGATREEDLTGVWASNKKIAACGVKLKRWITMHGVAINVDIRSLGNFDGIVPCGLEGREVTCVNNEIVGKQYTLQEFAVHLKAALEEIFGITLVIVA